jgi:hypothetical protein
MKYYSNLDNDSFNPLYGEEKKFGRRLIGCDGEKAYNVFKCGTKIPYQDYTAANVDDWLKKGYIVPASDKLIKEFGLTKTGFYIANSGKPFSIKVDFEKFSRYIWELKENGDWEPAMIEGPDYDVYYKAGSARAIRFDKKVADGDWIKVEVEEIK